MYVILSNMYVYDTKTKRKARFRVLAGKGA